MAELTPEQFAKKTLSRADLLIRAVGLKLFSSVIRDTPVGNPDLWRGARSYLDTRKTNAPEGYVGGRLRANWRCSLSAADTTTDESTSHERAVPHVEQTLEKATRKDTLWLANSLPYAHSIEYDGHSQQAPEGMVRRNAARIRRLLSEELGKLKK